MASKTIEIHRVGAEIFRGDAAMCKKKCVEVLEELGLPTGLLPLEELEEFIEEMEAGSEKVFRSLVQTRVALLNIHTLHIF